MGGTAERRHCDLARRVVAHLSGGAFRWFDTKPLQPVRLDYANQMDDSAERHYTEECQQTKKAKQPSGTASASNKSRFMAQHICLWLRRTTKF